MIKALPGGFNGVIGYLYPNDQDGIIFASLFDPAFKKEGVEAGGIQGALRRGCPTSLQSSTSSNAHMSKS